MKQAGFFSLIKVYISRSQLCLVTMPNAESREYPTHLTEQFYWTVLLFNVRFGFKKEEATSTGLLIIKPAQDGCRQCCHLWDIITGCQDEPFWANTDSPGPAPNTLWFHSITSCTLKSHPWGTFSLLLSL